MYLVGWRRGPAAPKHRSKARWFEKKKQKFLDDLSIPVWPFVYMVKAGQPSRPKPLQKKGEIMPQYLVANYLPDNFDPSTVTEAMIEEIHALNRELIAAGARKFA